MLECGLLYPTIFTDLTCFISFSESNVVMNRETGIQPFTHVFIENC